MIRQNEILQRISEKTAIPKKKILTEINELKNIIKESTEKEKGVIIDDFIRVSYIKRNGEKKPRITLLFKER